VARRQKTRRGERSRRGSGSRGRKAIELQANRAGIETVQGNGQGAGFSVAEAAASYLKDLERRAWAYVECYSSVLWYLGILPTPMRSLEVNKIGTSCAEDGILW